MTELTIGAMARATGITASALRFYDDCGLLSPARVDPVTGYRYYAEEQCERAVRIRRLREIGMPLAGVGRILGGDPAEAARLLDEHVRELRQRAQEAAEVAAAIKQGLGAVVVLGAALADAVRQVRPAAAIDGEFPVLTGVFIEADGSSLTLTATDRYRLSTRTLVPLQAGNRWSVTADVEGLAAVQDWLRAAGEVSLSADADALVLAAGDSERRCALIDEPFPDYRAVLTGLAGIRTRVVVERAVLIAAADRNPLVLSVTESGLTVSDSGNREPLPAVVSGPPVDIAFAPDVLRAALSSAVGPDVMLDISAADQPVVVRSATDGDLTTLVMPIQLP
ncbi:DNA polymerase III subunit beta family protein [Nocardia goodfellowii]|uniref:DNA-binding transcriptional MerR regulator n=1 Tax=Nocardia goodfellowii TaxID=882446 RepID=A0ABS4QRU4_9NOCA|nr:MerR family transcriptional regulator [Nocardia goodfellowii]MBP2194427.1 DNA-binding transcriptional MerR regulator [Nocardia goodfellowii]